MPRSWIRHFGVLAFILFVAAGLRFHKIAHEGDTLDELWSLSLATGRDAVLPVDRILDPPPEVLFENAPAAWHVWTSMDGTTHPPLYFLLLRWWIDLFGQSDFAIRSLSVVFSLTAIVVMFDIVRRISGGAAGLFAAAACALAWSQIDLSQDARNYTINFVAILLATHALVRIEQRGVSPGRVFQLWAAASLELLSHYFCFFTLAGIGAYALVFMRGRRRAASVGAIFAAVLFFALVWGKWFLIEFGQRDALTAPGGVPWAVDGEDALHHLWHAIQIVAVHLYGKLDPMTVLTVGFVAVLVLVVPLLAIRRKHVLMLFWFQVVAAIAGVVAMDIARHTSMVNWQRYTSMAAPAICALAVAPLALADSISRFWKWCVPVCVLFSLAVSAAAQYQMGPRSKEDFRYFAGKIDSMAGPSDLLVFYSPGQIPPCLWILDLAHYHRYSRPILILDHRAGASLLAKLNQYNGHLFLIGQNAPVDGPALLAGWTPGRTFINIEAKGVPAVGGSIAQMKIETVRDIRPDTIDGAKKYN